MVRKFNFAVAVGAMLARIGAKPHDGMYALALTTKAGELRMSVNDTWLATKFEDVAAATATVTCGCLNRASGKWNWHFTKPTAEDVDRLERVLTEMLVTPPPQPSQAPAQASLL